MITLQCNVKMIETIITNISFSKFKANKENYVLTIPICAMACILPGPFLWQLLHPNCQPTIRYIVLRAKAEFKILPIYELAFFILNPKPRNNHQ